MGQSRGSVCPRWWHRKVINLPPPIDTTHLQQHVDFFKIWKLDELLSTTKDKRYTLRWVGEAEPWSHITLLLPNMATHNRERSFQTSIFPRGVGSWCLTMGTLVPGIFIGKMSFQNIWLRKTMGRSDAQGRGGGKVLLETGILLLEGSLSLPCWTGQGWASWHLLRPEGIGGCSTPCFLAGMGEQGSPVP